LRGFAAASSPALLALDLDRAGEQPNRCVFAIAVAIAERACGGRATVKPLYHGSGGTVATIPRNAIRNSRESAQSGQGSLIPVEGAVLIRYGWFAALAILGAASSAHAGAASPASATVTAPAWQGFYAGVYASDDITALHLDMQDAFSFDGIGGESGFGGALLGYNNHFAERWVDGAEIDAALATGSSRFDVSDGPDYFNSSVSGQWGASLKGRIGYLVSPDTLFYAFGGGVVAVASYGCTSSEFDCPARMQKTMYGWPLAGLGVETQISQNWRLRYEYEVKFLPTLDFDTISVTPFSGTANLALIRDFGGPSGKTAATPDFGFAPKTWTGFHAGVAGGYSMSMTKFSGTEDPYSATFDGLGGGGPVGGIFAGYDRQLGNVVLGVDGGYYLNGGRLQGGVDGYGSFNITGHSYYTVTGRAGLVVTPSTMVYAMGGWIHADGALNLYDETGTLVDGITFGRDGEEIGGGIETWLNRNLSVRAQYEYAMFGSLPETEGIDVDSHVGTATLGAVLHFGK
jgi:outer membrane immunogenic protein